MPLATKPKTKRRLGLRNLAPWLLLGTVSTVAVGALRASSQLHAHATQRHQVVETLGQLETIATRQAALTWNALTLLMADERLSFNRLRGDEQRVRSEFYACLEQLQELRSDIDSMPRSWGLGTETQDLAELERLAGQFSGSIQGAFGQMSMSPERLRDRLRHWDMGFGPLKGAIDQLKLEDVAAAEDASLAANRAATGAAITRLLACALLAWRIGRLKAGHGPGAAETAPLPD